MIVVTCGRNVARWIGKCCLSVLAQRFQDWRMAVYDDCSSDGMCECVPGDDRITVVVNKKRRWKLGNVVESLKAVGSQEPVVLLDGDDWLLHDEVLGELDWWYRQVDLVWALHEVLPKHSVWKDVDGLSPQFGVPVRDWCWRGCHLSSFRKYLFELVPEWKLVGDDGAYFKAATDPALFMPMIELSGARWLHVPKPMAVYNRENENTHGGSFVDGRARINRKLLVLQRECLKQVRNRN